MAAKAIAYANNDVVQIGWSVDAKIPGCIGFAVYRLPEKADMPEVPLTSHIGFAEGSPSEWVAKPTTEQPIAGFRWRDLAPPPHQAVRYKIVAMQGPAEAPRPMPGFVPLVTPPVTSMETCGNVSVYFNRGILSTQHLSRALAAKGEHPDAEALKKYIGKPGDSLRLGLTGELLKGLTSLVRRARDEGGTCHAALYELTDQELIGLLAALPELEIVLSNNGTGDRGKPYDDGNRPAAAALAGKALYRRYMPTGQIGHNKFVVYVGPDGEPKAVMTGSTNWTPTGLCTQSNNVIVVESTELAKRYLDYWERLKADAQAVGIPAEPAPMRGIQGARLRSDDAVPPPTIQIPGGPSAEAWFSPNMPGLMRKSPPLPPDLERLFELCDRAEQAVLFLCFQPGSAGSTNATIVRHLSALSEKRPGLLVRGVISDEAEAEEFMRYRDPDEDADVIAPAGILDGFAAWETEFYRAGNAIVHDKIVVIDPFTDRCVVATGSHNLGCRASYNNDENLLILRGDRRVAQAYATHVFDIYSHYRWRYYLKQKADALAYQAWKADGGDKERKKDFPPSAYFHQVVSWTHNEADDAWQDRYFDPASMASLERQFWVSEGQPLAARIPRRKITKRRGAVPMFRAARGAKKPPARRKRAAGTRTASTARKAAAKRPSRGAARKPASRKAPMKRGKKRAVRRG